MYRRCFLLLPARVRISIGYLRAHGKLPRLRDPKTFTDKIQFRKLHERDERFVQYSDKAAVKEFVADTLGAEWCIPTHYCGKSLPEKPEWPMPFVIKPTHASGLVSFVLSEEDYAPARALAAAWLTWDFSSDHCEWHYSRIDPRIIVEPLIGSGDEPPDDYKFFVFDGRVEMIQVDVGRFVDHRRAIYDTNWLRQGFGIGYELPEHAIDRPEHLEEMIAAAQKLAAGFAFVRVDFYELEDGPRFGEMTFTPDAGYVRFTPPQMDRVLGDLWPMTSDA